MPTLDDLAESMNVVFFTSLLEEEGRAATFSIAYASPDVAEANGYTALRFAQAIDLEPSKVAKLAPSTHREHTLLGIQRNTATGSLEIWGLVEVGDRTFSIDLSIRPIFLRIVAHRPGVLSVEYGQREILTYAHGQHHFRKHDDLNVTSVLRQATASGAVAHEFERIARRMLLHGHGGALLLVQAGDTAAQVTMHRHYTFAPPDTVLKGAYELHHTFVSSTAARVPGETPAQGAVRAGLAEKRHRDAIQHVARMSAVDGAVLMTTDLTVLGYGVTIVSGLEAPALRLIDPRRGQDSKEIDLGHFPGNRHRTAALFCAAQSGLGVAIVASQDGVLSLFGRQADGGVTVVRPIMA